MLTLLATLSLAQTPGCGLTVDGDLTLGQGTITAHGWTGAAQGLLGVTLSNGPLAVQSHQRTRSPLSSLTVRPKGGPTVSFTCTQTHQVSRPDLRARPIPVVCVADRQHTHLGLNRLTVHTGAVQWTVSARATEFRLAAQTASGDFAAAWSDEQHPYGNTRLLAAFGHRLLCWRL